MSTPGTSASGAPFINRILLNFFSPRRAAAAPRSLMVVVMMTVMKPSCLTSLHAPRKVTGGDGGEEDSRLSSARGVRFHLSTSRCSNREARADRRREGGSDGGWGAGGWGSRCESYTYPAIQMGSAAFSSVLCGFFTNQRRNEQSNEQPVFHSLWL